VEEEKIEKEHRLSSTASYRYLIFSLAKRGPPANSASEDRTQGTVYIIPYPLLSRGLSVLNSIVL
jgi:hypothetical protein